MTILITGSAGHLGEALMRTLRATSQDARGIDIVPSEFTDRTGTIADRAFVRECMKGVRTVIHAATLHKPHVATHSLQEFVDTNITGTLALLEEAVAAGVESFVFTSTTSTFGSALTPAEGMPAAWITEDVVPVPKNIYGVTKTSAESLCELFHRRQRLPVVVLKTSRFFPEEDDDATARSLHSLDNAQANELLHRRADIEDVVEAHLLAARRAPRIGFGRYIVSATTPFTRDDLPMLRESAPAVLRRLFPEAEELYAKRGWTLPARLDRVYVNELARRDLGWQPRHDFAHMLRSLRDGSDFRSQLARDVGSKGYHAETFDEGPYPVAT
ncbi:NAD(P)-dependent oxidoreductase [Variovorax sp. NFACC27]|uniref:NAD-dependent epimerase/dehydratase family protein n=1 Tax=unclassified Variovorax TaxID=663243 RepID=UPI0008950373|nr:NAD dependent epimerase/dehydratase family protein [Variovorax sp. NFACC28]SEG88387.1 NAD dependent epimerase/dehydratase family protein [Variovorax sp. NFACC29]SFD25567.1 NAD dependent epimerase/dehydratase family protein [Variovorax sp. NFACC26]SFG36257.1 NAD dependent epimerase/dehydratase family protein [Variovorax sp. NFACC27]